MCTSSQNDAEYEDEYDDTYDDQATQIDFVFIGQHNRSMCVKHKHYNLPRSITNF